MNDCINNCCSIDLCTLLLLMCCCGNNNGNPFGNMGSCCCNLPLILLLTCCGTGNSYGGCK